MFQVSAAHPSGVPVHGVAAATPGITSVPNVRTRGPCVGDTPWLPVLAMNQVLFAMAAWWSGAGEVTGVVFPRPPPNCPTITIDVGILFAPDRNERLLVRLIVRACPEGTVITTGDQPVAVGFNAAHVAAGPLPVPQKYPHIGTVEPSATVRSEEHTS